MKARRILIAFEVESTLPARVIQREVKTIVLRNARGACLERIALDEQPDVAVVPPKQSR